MNKLVMYRNWQKQHPVTAKKAFTLPWISRFSVVGQIKSTTERTHAFNVNSLFARLFLFELGERERASGEARARESKWKKPAKWQISRCIMIEYINTAAARGVRAIMNKWQMTKIAVSLEANKRTPYFWHVCGPLCEFNLTRNHKVIIAERWERKR
jgi:hypothetical protein